MSKAYCAGWGKIYLTDDVLPNQWDKEPTFWDALVDAVYSDHTTGACPDQQTQTLMVPLYLDSSPGAHACHPLLFDQQNKSNMGMPDSARGQ